MLLAAVSAIGSSCAPEGAVPDGKLGVVVSVPAQRFVVERLAGELVRVTVLVPPGANPTTHGPTLAELRAVREASLFVRVGHPDFAFEAAWLDRLLAEAPGLTVVDGFGPLEARGRDPHLWNAPPNVAGMVDRVEAALIETLPSARAEVAANAAALRAEVDALDREIREALAPYAGRAFLVFHPAWGAFAQHYGLEQVAVEHEHKEPDAGALARRIADARAAGVRVVFVQPQFSQASARVVADEIGARVEVLDPLASDWDENLRDVTLALVRSFEEAAPAR